MRSPSICMITGMKSGTIASKSASTIDPLMIFPNSRTASAMVRENSLITWNGAMKKFGLI